MKYIYFVSYVGSNRFGCSEVSLLAPITHLEQIQAITHELVTQLAHEDGADATYVVIAYQLLRTEASE